MIKNIANKVMIGKGIFLAFSAVMFVTFKCYVQFFFSSWKRLWICRNKPHSIITLKKFIRRSSINCILFFQSFGCQRRGERFQYIRVFLSTGMSSCWNFWATTSTSNWLEFRFLTWFMTWFRFIFFGGLTVKLTIQLTQKTAAVFCQMMLMYSPWLYCHWRLKNQHPSLPLPCSIYYFPHLYVLSVTALTCWVASPKMFYNWYRI